MTRKLQNPQDAHDAEDLDDAPHVVELLGALVRLDQRQRHVVGQDGEQVDDVERALEELALVGTGPEAQHVLEREPRDADALHLLQVFGLVLQRRHRVERQADGGEDDEEDRDDRQHLQDETHHRVQQSYSERRTCTAVVQRDESYQTT